MRNAVNHGRFSGLVHIKEQDFYQIEASVNPGWSGGPVLDAEGKVVAIVAMKAADMAVAEIRGSMGKLDQDFRTRIGRTAYNVGLTYGIPSAALWGILKDPDFQSEERQAEANDQMRRQDLDRPPEFPRRALHAPRAGQCPCQGPRRGGGPGDGQAVAQRPPAATSGRHHDLPLGARCHAFEPPARQRKRQVHPIEVPRPTRQAAQPPSRQASPYPTPSSETCEPWPPRSTRPTSSPNIRRPPTWRSVSRSRASPAISRNT